MSSRTAPKKPARAAGKRPRKRENTRARLVEAAADVIATKGIAATRIDDVVGEAGFTRGAFYSNYSSLQEVLTEAIIARANALMERVTAAVEAMEAPTMESLMEMLDSIRPEARAIHLLTSEYTLYRLRHPDSPQMAAGREELIARFSEIIEKVLARMGRRPAVSTTSLADVICLLYLDSVVNQPARSAGSTAAPPAQAPPSDAGTSTYEVIEAVLLGLSESVEASPGVGSPA